MLQDKNDLGYFFPKSVYEIMALDDKLDVFLLYAKESYDVPKAREIFAIVSKDRFNFNEKTDE